MYKYIVYLRIELYIGNIIFVTPAPKVWFSNTVEAFESNLFPSSGWIRGNPQKCRAEKKKSPKVPAAGRVSLHNQKLKCIPTTVIAKHKLLVTS